MVALDQNTKVPANYFCQFDFTMEKSESCLIEIFRYRFNYRKQRENIEMKIVQYKEDEPSSVKSEDYLSNKIIVKNSQLHRYSGTAQA